MFWKSDRIGRFDRLNHEPAMPPVRFNYKAKELIESIKIGQESVNPGKNREVQPIFIKYLFSKINILVLFKIFNTKMNKKLLNFWIGVEPVELWTGRFSGLLPGPGLKTLMLTTFVLLLLLFISFILSFYFLLVC